VIAAIVEAWARRDAAALARATEEFVARLALDGLDELGWRLRVVSRTQVLVTIERACRYGEARQVVERELSPEGDLAEQVCLDLTTTGITARGVEALLATTTLSALARVEVRSSAILSDAELARLQRALRVRFGDQSPGQGLGTSACRGSSV
jgi:hypothetical protein